MKSYNTSAWKNDNQEWIKWKSINLMSAFKLNEHAEKGISFLARSKNMKQNKSIWLVVNSIQLLYNTLCHGVLQEWKASPAFSSTCIRVAEEKIIKCFKINRQFNFQQSLNHKWLKARGKIGGTTITPFFIIIFPRHLVLAKNDTEVDRPLVWCSAIIPMFLWRTNQ